MLHVLVAYCCVHHTVLNQSSVNANRGEFSVRRQGLRANPAQPKERYLAEAFPSAQERQRSLKRLHRKLSNDSSLIRVMVAYRNENGRKAAQHASIIDLTLEHPTISNDSVSAMEYQPIHKYISLSSHLNVVPVYLNSSGLFELGLNPDILYVEEDEKVSLFSASTLVQPYGRTLVQATLADTVIPSAPSDDACSNPNAIKVALIDSGILASHPDLPCISNGTGYANCIGNAFGLPSGMTWDSPSDSHGTMVAGIVGATAQKSSALVGLLGVASAADICWVIARVFESVTVQAYLSDIYDGVTWAVDQGAKVINMSLGGPGSSVYGKSLYEKLWNQYGIITVAASGNAGSNAYSYPASYPGVISVSAIQENLQLAKFSQTNDAVDLTAPGNEILSTALLNQGNEVWYIAVTDDTSSSIPISKVAVSARPFQMSLTPPSTGLQGTLVECPDSNQLPCPGSSGGHICLAPL